MSSNNLERRILEGLIVSDEFLKRVMVKEIWRDELVEAPEMRRIATWCINYWKKYERAPKLGIGQVFFDALRDEGIPKAEAQLIEAVLERVSDDYGDGADPINAAYLFDKTVAYFRDRAVAQHTEQVEDLRQRGRLEEAEALAAGFRPIIRGDDGSLAAVTPRVVSWVWQHRIPLGKLTLFAGDSDEGKSTVLLDIAAKITSDSQWPDGTGARKGAALIASTEDDYEDTVVPRLMAAGADLNLCHAIGLDAPDVKTLCREIERKVEALRDGRPKVKAVLIDPLSAFLGKVDGHNEGAVRVMLRPLLEAAMKHRFAVISLHHTRKSGSGGSAKDQVSGSKAFVAVARSAFLVARDRDDETKHLVLPLKGNLVADANKSGLAYRIVGTDLTLRTRLGAVTTSVPRIQWLDEAVTVSADEALEAVRGRPTKLSEVSDWPERHPARRAAVSPQNRTAGRRCRVLDEDRATCSRRPRHREGQRRVSGRVEMEDSDEALIPFSARTRSFLCDLGHLCRLCRKWRKR